MAPSPQAAAKLGKSAGGVAKNKNSGKKKPGAVDPVGDPVDEDEMDTTDAERKKQRQNMVLAGLQENANIVPPPGDDLTLNRPERSALPQDVEEDGSSGPGIKTEPGETSQDPNQTDANANETSANANKTGADNQDIDNHDNEDNLGDNQGSESDSDSEVDPDEEEDKWNPVAKQKKSYGEHGPRVEGTVKRWAGKLLLVADGPKRSSRYRLYRTGGAMDHLDSSTAPVLRQHERIGMQTHITDEGEKKYMYGEQHRRAIVGVAWYVDNEILDKYRKYFPRPVDLVKPKMDDEDFPLIKTTKNGRVRESRMQVVDCLVKIRWFIDGKFQTSWESRDTTRRVFKKKTADIGIYEAAKYQEQMFEKWVNSQESHRDRSTTPWPLGLRATPEREFKNSPSPPGGFIPGRGGSEDQEETPQPQMATLTLNPNPTNPPPPAGTIPKQSLAEWKAEYYEMMDIKSAKDMTAEEKGELMVAWGQAKALMAAA